MRVDNLCNENEMQLSLFDSNENKKQKKIDETLDNLRKKFGYNSITRAGKLEIEKNIKLK